MKKLTLNTDKDQLLQSDSLELEKTDKSPTTIDLGASKEYENRLCETIDYLNQVQEELTTCMFSIAVNGKWKEWSDEQTIGTTITLNKEFLRDSGDKNIDLLIKLLDKIDYTKDEIKTQNPSIVKALEENKATADKNLENKVYFEQLMQRKPSSKQLVFNDEEMEFLGKYDLVSFSKKFRAEAEFYMQCLC